jgi:phage gp29-like protein
MAKKPDLKTPAVKRMRAATPKGESIDVGVMTQEISAATVGSVRSPQAGYPTEGLNPARLANIMRAADQGNPMEFFEMAEIIEERDLHYLGVLGKRKREVSQIEVRVEPASEDAEHVAQADFVRSWLERDTLQQELFDMLDAVGKGISFTEIIWDRSEGQWWPQKLEWVTQRFFTFDKVNLNTPLLRNNAGDVPLPYGKFIIPRIQAKSGLSVRSGVARAAAWSWMFKMFTAKDWALFSQTYGQPIRIGKYPSGATKEDRATLLRAVTNIAADCAAIIPQGMDLAFVEAKTASQSGENYEKRCDWLDRQVSKLVLGSTTGTDAVKGGYATSKQHREVEMSIARADATALQGTLNQHLIKVWIDLQYGPQALYPKLIIEDPDETDIPVMADGLAKLVPLGLRVSHKEVREKMGLREPENDDDVLRVEDLPPPEGKIKPPTPPAKFKAEKLTAETLSEADLVDALEASALDDWEELVEPIVAQVRAEIQQASSLEDLKQRIASLAPRIDVNTLTDMLTDAKVTAHIAGLSGVPLQVKNGTA